MSNEEELVKHRIASLTPAQRQVLAHHLNASKGLPRRSATTPSSITREPPLRTDVDTDGKPVKVYAASNGQQRMWFLHHLAEKPLYNTPSAFSVRGNLQASILERAFRRIIERHESLRTTFAMENGQLVQRIVASSVFCLEQPCLGQPCLDQPCLEQPSIQQTPGADRKSAAQLCIENASCVPFDLSIGPPFRVVLVSIEADEHLLLILMHHIISDGWSFSNLCKELSSIYAEIATGATTTLPELPIQYADFSAWQRRLLQTPVFGQQAAYWKKKLAGKPDRLNLPPDQPRSAGDELAGDHCSCEIDAALATALRAQAKAQGASLFMILLAAFQVLLYRYTAQEDISIGVPVANRQRPDLATLIGLVTNTLVIRNTVSADATFAEHLQRVRETALEAYEHQDMPFDVLVRLLGARRDAGITPLFQAAFSVRDFDENSLQLVDLEVTPHAVSTHTAKFELSLEVRPQGQALLASLEFDAGLYSSARGQMILHHWHALLHSIAAGPELPIANLAFFAEGEKSRVLEVWNRTDQAFPVHERIHDLFERQVARAPDAVAVKFEHESWTYRELNRRSNRLARHLRTLGVGPEVFVGICMGRSADMVAAMLGVLQAGGAYVPLDPQSPPARVAMILEDAEVAVLLTERAMISSCQDFAGTCVFMDEIYGGVDEADVSSTCTAPEVDIQPSNAAYVIYTSGSTGRPKGVVIEHKSAVNFLYSMRSSPGMRSSDVMLAVASISFDLSVSEILLPLSVGACVVIAPEIVRTDGTAFAALLVSCGATVLQATPATWQMLKRTGWEGRKNFTAHIGGDAVPVELANWILERCSELWNCYGPTEITVISHVQRIRKGDAITIGRSQPNVKSYVVDPQGRPVPIGVAGELWIGGSGVARGYLKRPELNAERFIQNPFTPDRPGRLYKTGDMVRLRPDGAIEFVGRIDFQVKIRGFRVEPGEIEAVLSAHPDIASCAVLTTDLGPEKTLLAFVVGRGRSEISIRTLRQWLAPKLPDHMIPSRFLQVPALPLNTNGKVDRKALAQLEGMELNQDATYLAPRTQQEADLAEIWQAALHRDRVGVQDNFFELGGHSLLALSMSLSMANRLGVQVPVRWLLENPTIESLTLRLGAAELRQPTSAVIVKADRSQPLPMSFSQQQMWLLRQTAANPATYNLTVAWHVAGTVDGKKVRSALQVIQNRHEVLRTALVQRGNELVQEVAEIERAPLPWKETDLRAISSSERQHAAQRCMGNDARDPFDLNTLPLWRATLITLDERQCILAFTFHHSIMDEWSLRLFLQELGVIYSGSKPDDLPQLPIQYADYAVWQRQQASGPVFRQMLAYWSRELADLPPGLQLPADLVRPLQNTDRGDTVEFQLTGEVVANFRACARKQQTTLFCVLLAAFYVWLYRCTGQSDLVVAAPIANRERPEVSALLGCFLNTLPLRARLDDSLNFLEIVGMVKGSVLAAFDHAGLPFEQILEAAVKEHDIPRDSLFRAMFVLLEEEDIAPRLGSAPGRLSTVETQTSKSDIALHIRATQQTLTCRLQYSAELFSVERAEGMVRLMTELFQSICDAPSKPIRELDFLPGIDRDRILLQWNRTTRHYPHEKLIHELFEEQAKRTPDAVAVMCNSERLTYHELDVRSDHVACGLRSLGVKPDTVVGLCLERTIHMLEAMLGILKTGAAYLPLDTRIPPSRLVMILEDAGVEVLVTDGAMSERSAGFKRSRVLIENLQSGRDDAWRGRSGVRLPGPSPSSAAYVIYTSGSTGRPKGVVVEHRSVVNLMYAAMTEPGIVADDVLVAVSTISFDISVLEMFLPLAVGARVVIAPDDIRSDPAALAALLQQSGATILQATPTTWRMLIGSEWAGVPQLRAWAGGEAMTADLAEKILARCAELWNLYGPTETTIYSLGTRIHHGDAITIGGPLPNTSVYVVDAQGRLVPAGVTGELWIGGMGVARGYLNRPDLTAERFIEDPFSTIPESRLYKSGDLARWRCDGAVDFLGRADSQVKIRGYRIELGEIEAVLNEYPEVAGAAIAAQEAEAGKELVAFVALRRQAVLSSQSLRNWLLKRLPDYMVPGRFIEVPALPMNLNGKVDLTALLKLSGTQLPADSGYVAPRDRWQRDLAGIWQTALHREPVGIHDNFFDLGGHSLTAVLVCSHISGHLGVEVPVRWLLELPTIEALANRLKSSQGELQIAAAMEPVSRAEPLPMSSAQRQMWLLRQTMADAATYNQPVVWRLSGPVDVPRVRHALQAILERHEILRTILLQRGEDLVQAILPASQVSLPFLAMDLPGASPGMDVEAVERLLIEEVRKPFDLAALPLWRVLWIVLDSEESIQQSILAFTFHHSIMDEWSLRLFFHELEAFYSSTEAAVQPNLPPLRIQYAEYAAWETKQLVGVALQGLHGYWLKQMENPPPVLELPGELRRSPGSGNKGASHEFQWHGGTAQALRTIARAERTTLFTVMLAALHVWLYRCTQQGDLVIAAPIANRNRPEVHDLLGCFLNTLPIRARLEGSLSFTQVLHQVRDTVLDGMGHAMLPFEEILKLTAGQRAFAQHSLYQVMLLMLDEEVNTLRLPQIQSRLLTVETGTSKNDLTLSVRPSNGSLFCRLQYATAIFSAQQAETMARHLTTLVQSIAADPGRPISVLNIIPESERRLFQSLNQTRREFLQHACIHHLFEEQVRRTPDAVALRFATEAVTYRELNERADTLADRLQGLGVGPETLVGVLMSRSAAMLVALLGVLKAGGAYVPLDPYFPPGRLAMILQDSEARWLLTQRSLSPACPEFAGMVLFIEDSAPATGVALQQASVRPDNTAYVMYTSGSSGRPKGVVVEHRAVVNLLRSMSIEPGLDSRDVLLSVTTMSFDISVLEFFLPLSVGACVVIAPDDVRADGAALAALLDQCGATVMQATPVTYQMLLTAGWTGNKKLKALIGGEALTVDLARRLAGPCAELWNMYGPTETTIWSLAARVRAGEPVTIGKPISNTAIYVVDLQGQPTPVGVPGELWIGGAGVARGYLHQPDLTAARFITDLNGHSSYARLYKTGDRVVRRSDGNIDFLGRLDTQVKIRGFRVELGEIEAVLRDRAQAVEAVVAVRESSQGTSQLIAYLTGSTENRLDVSILRERLAEALPDYMLPNAIVWLDRIPLTHNGKVDRASLPVAQSVNSVDLGEKHLPENLLEARLTAIWRRFFHRNDVGRTDNFFSLGGDSILATRLAVEIDKLLNCRLPAATLFQSPTIESLARRLNDENWVPPFRSIVSLQPLGSRPPLFFVHGIGGDVYWCVKLAHALGLEQPSFGIQAVGLDAKSERHETIEKMAAHYASELVSFQPQGPFYLAGYSMGGVLAFEVAQQLWRGGREVAMLAILDTWPMRATPRLFYPLVLAHYLRSRFMQHFRKWRTLDRDDRAGFLRGRWAGLQDIILGKRRPPAAIAEVLPAGALSARSCELQDYYDAVGRLYNFSPYPGSMDLFVSEGVVFGANRYWRHLVQGGLIYHRIPGTHHEILSVANAPFLTACLREVLETRQENPPQSSALALPL